MVKTQENLSMVKTENLESRESTVLMVKMENHHMSVKMGTGISGTERLGKLLSRLKVKRDQLDLRAHLEHLAYLD